LASLREKGFPLQPPNYGTPVWPPGVKKMFFGGRRTKRFQGAHTQMLCWEPPRITLCPLWPREKCG